jgi:DNA-binding CsgD family transcriptional regulator
LLDLRSVERQAFASVIDSLQAGVCIVGSEGRLLYANPAAQNMLNEQKSIRSDSGHLRAVARTGTDPLLRAIDEARSAPHPMAPTGIGVPLNGKSGEPAIAHVLPLDGGNLRTRLMPDALAAVFVQSVAPAQFADLETVAHAFGFTRMEAEVTKVLVDGLSLPEAAEMLGIGNSTARTHLNSVFAKCNVSRQADLLALLERLVPMARSPR